MRLYVLPAFTAATVGVQGCSPVAGIRSINHTYSRQADGSRTFQFITAPPFLVPFTSYKMRQLMSLSIVAAVLSALGIIQGCTFPGPSSESAANPPASLPVPPESVSAVPPSADQKTEYRSLANDMDTLTRTMANMASYPGGQDVATDWATLLQFGADDSALLEYTCSVMSRLVWGLEHHVGAKRNRVISRSAAGLKSPMFAAMAFQDLSAYIRSLPKDEGVDALEVARRRKLVTSVLETLSGLAVSVDEGSSRSADLDELYKHMMNKRTDILGRQGLYFLYADIALLKVIDRGEALGAMGRFNEIAHWDSKLDGRITNSIIALLQRTSQHIDALFRGVLTDRLSHYKVMPYPFSPIVDLE